MNHQSKFRCLVSFPVLLVLLAAPGVGAQKRDTTAKDQVAFGVEMAQRGLWSEALFRFRQAEKLEGENVTVLNNLAVTHEALGNFEEALTYYQKAIKLAGSNRSLKRNYSRFLEFYQSFKPKEEEGEEADAGSDESQGSPAGTPVSPGEPDKGGPGT